MKKKTKATRATRATRVDYLKSMNLNIASMAAKTGVIIAYLETIVKNTARADVGVALPMSKEADAFKWNVPLNLDFVMKMRNGSCRYRNNLTQLVFPARIVCTDFRYQMPDTDLKILAVYKDIQGSDVVLILNRDGTEIGTNAQKLYNPL